MVYFACSSAATTRRMLAVVFAVSSAAAALIVLLMLGLALASASAGQLVTHDVRGTVTVPFGASAEPVSCGLSVDDALRVLGRETTAPCPAGVFGEYADVADGTTVVITDRVGTVLATSQLAGGVADGGSVTFGFTFEDVPETDGYAVEVNTRGAVPVPRDRLADDGWKVALDLR